MLGDQTIATKRKGQDPTLQDLLELVKSASLVAKHDSELLDARGAHVDALEAALSDACAQASVAQRAAGQTILAMQERMGALLVGGGALAVLPNSEVREGGEIEAEENGGDTVTVAASVKGSMIAAYNKARVLDEDAAGKDASAELRAQVLHPREPTPIYIHICEHT